MQWDSIPANSEAARMFSENKCEYNRRVREIVEQSWIIEEPEWWWRALSYIPYLITLQMSDTGFGGFVNCAKVADS